MAGTIHNSKIEHSETVFSPEELSRLLRVSVSTLSEWRRKEVGPGYMKLQRRRYQNGKMKEVFQYQLSALKSWIGNEVDFSEQGIRLLKTGEVASLLGVSTVNLRKLRERGQGPKFLKLCGTVRYLEKEVNSYIQSLN